MKNKWMICVALLMMVLIASVATLGFQCYSLNKDYRQLLLKEGLTVFQYALYPFKDTCISSIQFTDVGDGRTVRVDVTLQNRFDSTGSPAYKIVLYDAFGLVVGESTQNWFISTLKPGEVRKQDFTFTYDGGVMPKYLRLYDQTRFERNS